MRRRINIPLMLLSLLISVSLWFVVYGASIPGPEVVPVPLVLNNLDQSRWWKAKVDSKFPLRILAPKDKLQAIKDSPWLEAEVDLQDPQEGTNRYPVTVYPGWVTPFLLDKSPTASITLEQMVSKQVDLVVEEVGSLADSDFKLQSLTPSVTSVMVIGPKSEVDKATHARARLLLKTIEPLKPKPIPTDIVVLDKSGSELRLVKSDPHTVYVTPIIVAAPVEKTVIVEANFVGSPAPGFRLNGYKLDKETISISGRSAVLAALSKISTQPIDVSGITSDRHFKAKLVFPSGTQATGVSSITGTYYIAPDPAFQGKTPVDNRNPPASTGGVP